MIDTDYTGEVKVILRNHSSIDYEFKAGDSIGQLIVERIQRSEAITVEELAETERGTKDFGQVILDQNE